MIVLALLLLIAAAALVVFLIVTGTTQTVDLQWEALNVAWSPSVLVVFLLGAVTLLLVVLALGLIRGGTKRKVEQRRELKRLRKVEKENAAHRDDRADAPAHGRHPETAAAPAPTATHPTSDQPAAYQATQAQPTQTQATQTQPTHGQPTHEQPTRGSATQEQPPIYPRQSSTEPSNQGAWHDDPDGERPGGGKHEAR